MDDAHLRKTLTELRQRDPRIDRALDAVGYPPSRHRELSFATLLRIIVGQQLSVKAAATIFDRLTAAMSGQVSAAAVLALDNDTLRGAGLSARKVQYACALADAVVSGELDLDGLRAANDDEVITRLTAIKGVGRWTAQIVLMFCLDRPDVWPTADLGVRGAVGRMIGLAERPDAATCEELGETWRSYRSSVAILAWHYLHNAPA